MEDVYYFVRGKRIHALLSKESLDLIDKTTKRFVDEKINSHPLMDERPIIVLVHGLVVASTYLKELATSLSPWFPVFVPELPGFGESDKPEKVLRVPEIAEWLSDILQAANIKKACFAGNSMGCQVIVHLATQHPELVQSAFLQGPTMDKARRGPLRQIFFWGLNGFYDTPAMLPIIVHDYYKTGLFRAIKTFLYAMEDKIEDYLPRMNQPTLVIRGKKDTVCNDRWARYVTKLLPNGQMATIPKVAHTVNKSAPDVMARLITIFILTGGIAPGTEEADKVNFPVKYELDKIPYVAAFDSAAGMLRALSTWLQYEEFENLDTHLPVAEKAAETAAKMVNRLPKKLAELVFSFGGWMESNSPRKATKINSESLAKYVIDRYPKRKTNVLFIGSSNGALVHLGAAMNAPWLPQTLLFPFSRKTKHTNLTEEMNQAIKTARIILDNNPDLHLHHMEDPNQDQLMSHYFSYFRFKTTELGDCYKQFIEEVLEPGGVIVIVDCQKKWPTKKVGDRHFFQSGAIGGLAPEEYQEPTSKRVEEFGKQRDPKVGGNWNAPKPDCLSPEAEWGYEPALTNDIEKFAKQKGYRVKSLKFGDPEDLSPLVADLHRVRYKELGIESNQLIVDSFVLMEPLWTLRTGSVPLWTTFPVNRSLQIARAYLHRRYKEKPESFSDDEWKQITQDFDHIFIRLFNCGVFPPGMASVKEWSTLLDEARCGGSFLGVDKKAFPRDFASMSEYHNGMKNIPGRYLLPIKPMVTLDQFEQFMDKYGKLYKVDYTELPSNK